MGTFNHAALVGDELHASKEAPNIVLNGGLQVWDDGVSSQPENFTDVGGPTVDRDTGEADNFNSTPYSVKYTDSGSGGDGGSYTFSNLKASTKYGVHIRAKATAGDTARVHTTGGSTNIDTETTLTGWTSLTGTFETDGTPTNVVLNMTAKNASDIVWFCKIMVVEGDVIPTFAPRTEGGYWKLNGDDIYYNNGNVGIGTDTPFAPDANITILDIRDSTGGAVYFGRSDSTVLGQMKCTSALVRLGTYTDHPVEITVNNGTRGIYIHEGSGFVGVGVPVDPTANLDVQNPTDAASNLVAIFRGGNRTIAANNDEAYIDYYLDDHNEAQAQFARMTWVGTDVTASGKDCRLEFAVMTGNVLTDILFIDGEGITSTKDITIPNTGLHILDTNASHDLIIAPGSDLTADRTLTLTTGDSDRTITLNGNPTLDDWFDQSVKQTATPTFGNTTLGTVGCGTVTITSAGNSTLSQTSTSGKGLYITRNLAAASTNDSIVMINNLNAGDDQIVLQVANAGSGASIYASGLIYFPSVYSNGNAGGRDVYIQSNGQLTYLSSSLKYKENVRDLNNADWIYNLRPVLFDSVIGDKEKDLIGLIAEEVDLINKKMVSYKREEDETQDERRKEISYHDTDEPETVNYANPYFLVSLLKAIQDLREDVNSLLPRR